MISSNGISILSVLLCEDVYYLDEKDGQNHDEGAGSMEEHFPFLCVFSGCVFHIWTIAAFFRMFRTLAKAWS